MDQFYAVTLLTDAIEDMPAGYTLIFRSQTRAAPECVSDVQIRAGARQCSPHRANDRLAYVGRPV